MQCTKRKCTCVASNAADLRRHESWFCRKSLKHCNWGCEGSQLKNTSLWEHYQDESHTEFEWSFGDEIEGFIDEYTTGELKYNDFRFLFRFKLTETDYHVFLISTLDTDTICNYIIKVNLMDVRTGLYMSKELRSNNWQSNGTNDFFLNTTGRYDDFIDGSTFTARFQISTSCISCMNGENLPILSTIVGNCGRNYNQCMRRFKSDKNQRKHTKWFYLRSRRTCNWSCGEVLNNESLFDHYYNYFDNPYYTNDSNYVDVTENEIDEKYGCRINAFGKDFIVFYQLNCSSLHIQAVSELDAVDVDKFVIEILLFHEDSKFYVQHELSSVTWDNNGHYWDYLHDYCDNENIFDSLIYDDRYDIRFIIDRVCNECI